MTEIANDKNGGRVVLMQSTKGRSAPFETFGFRYSDLFRVSIFGFRYLNPQRFDQLILSRGLNPAGWLGTPGIRNPRGGR